MVEPNKNSSLDDVQSSTPDSRRQPDYRPDHELPAPDPVTLIDHKQPRFLYAGDDITEDKKSLVVKRSHSLLKWLLAGFFVFVVAFVALVAVGYTWYQQELSPVSSDTSKRIRVKIVTGSSAKIGERLQELGVIRNKTAFAIYTKLSNTENSLKEGTYSLQPSLSTSAIVNHLVVGKQDTFNVTLLPGDTLTAIRKKLINLNYTESEVDMALGKTYKHPLFATKPPGTDLEGYLFGETIEFDSSASAEDILNKFFDEFEAVVTENDLVNGFKKQGLSLYEGITLASIIQREVYTQDMPQVARVFLNRMKIGMTLGSDVTYQYIADKTGQERSPNLDSPYNTRKYPGLPPGPIASPGKAALLSVVHPASNDYLFFLSGDDGKTYYAKTDAEHQQNIVNYCQKKCSVN
ncbi:MAG: endolytic transglycosylase MltG [Candidatus Saccharimonadales bacterium]